MKKLLLIAFMVLALTFSASAFTVTNNNSTIGIVGSGTVSGTVTITNDETSNISVSGAGMFYTDGFNSSVTYSPSSASLNPGNSTTMTYSLSVPEDVQGRQTSTLNFTSGSSTETASLAVDVRQLKLEDLDVSGAGDDDNGIHDERDGYEIDIEFEPGDDVSFDLKLENLYSGDERESEIDIEDVEVTITIEDIDDGDEIDEESDSFDIDYDDDESVSLSFDIPYNAESGNYDVLIEIDAEDEEGNDQSFTREYELVVERENHRVKVLNANLMPSTISCDRKTELTFDMINIGDDDEDEVKVTVKNSALGINQMQSNLELDADPDDDDNEMEMTFNLEVGEDAAPGTYGIDIRTFFDTTKNSDFERVDLIVERCSEPEVDEEEEEEDDDENDTPVIITPEIPTDQDSDDMEEEEEAEAEPVTSGSPVEIQEPFTESVWFIVLLVAVNLIVLALVIWLIVKFLV